MLGGKRIRKSLYPWHTREALSALFDYRRRCLDSLEKTQRSTKEVCHTAGYRSKEHYIDSRDLRANFKKYIKTECFAGRKIVQSRSSGSTGVPMTIPHSPFSASLWMSIEYALFKFGNYGRKFTFNPLSSVIFLNSALDASEYTYRSPVLNFAKVYKINVRLTSSVQLNRLFLDKKIVFLSTDPATMRIMLQDSPAFDRFPGITISSGSQLTDTLRNAFENRFGTEVFDNYGSSEFGKIAVECWKHEGLHYDPVTLSIDVLGINEHRLLEEGKVGN